MCNGAECGDDEGDVVAGVVISLIGTGVWLIEIDNDCRGTL